MYLFEFRARSHFVLEFIVKFPELMIFVILLNC